MDAPLCKICKTKHWGAVHAGMTKAKPAKVSKIKRKR